MISWKNKLKRAIEVGGTYTYHPHGNRNNCAGQYTIVTIEDGNVMEMIADDGTNCCNGFGWPVEWFGK